MADVPSGELGVLTSDNVVIGPASASNPTNPTNQAARLAIVMVLLLLSCCCCLVLPYQSIRWLLSLTEDDCIGLHMVIKSSNPT